MVYHFKSLVWIICLFMIAARQGYSPELQRLESFIELRNDHGGEYLRRTSGCIQNHILQQGDRGSPRRPCKKVAMTVAKDLGIVRTTSSTANTCEYSVKTPRLVHSFGLGSRAIGTYIVELKVNQYNCTSGWVSADGKSFLRIEMDQSQTEGSVTTSSCHLHSINSAEYTYRCPLYTAATPTPVPEKECNALCGLNVTAVLDYEHYSAFDEVVGLTYGLNKVVISQPLPPLLLPEGITKDKKRKNIKDTALRCCSVEPTRESNQQIPVNTSVNTSASPPESTSTHLPVFQNTSALRAALDRLDAVYFVGDSHIRYLWDTVVHAHYNATALLTSLPQHHADEKVENVWYINNYFSMELPALLKEICSVDSAFASSTTTTTITNTNTNTGADRDKPKVVFVLQTGSWDLDFNPAQNMLLFPNSSSAVVQAVVNMAREGFLCNGREVQVLWLTSVPIPECEDTLINMPSMRHKSIDRADKKKEKTCFDKGYRNNYAIAAINQYFVRELEKYMYNSDINMDDSITNKYSKVRGKSSKISTGKKKNPRRRVTHDMSKLNLQIIDAFGIIYPHRNDNICGLHYLCCRHFRKERVEMQTSPGGEKLVRSVLESLWALGGG